MNSTQKAPKKIKCLDEEDGQTLVSKKYERWLLNEKKIRKTSLKKDEEIEHPTTPKILEKHLTWQSTSEVRKLYLKGDYVYKAPNQDILKELLWGKHKNHPDKNSLFSKLVGDIQQSLGCSAEDALDYATHNLASLQHFKGDKYLIKFSPDLLRAALHTEDEKGNPALKRRDKFKDDAGHADIPDEEIQSLKAERQKALAKKNQKSSQKE